MEKFDNIIIDLYNNGFSINYITRFIYKRLTKNKEKPIMLNGVLLVPVTSHSLSECHLYVAQTIYSYILTKNCAIF